MQEQILVPGVKDGGEADLGLQTFPASCQLKQRLSSCSKEDSVQGCLVLENERIEFVGQRDNDMVIPRGQDYFQLLVQPLCTLKALALRAVSVAAGVV